MAGCAAMALVKHRTAMFSAGPIVPSGPGARLRGTIGRIVLLMDQNLAPLMGSSARMRSGAGELSVLFISFFFSLEIMTSEVLCAVI